MRIVEIIFQDLFGCVSPVRLQLTGDVSSEELPPGVSAGNVQDLLISLFYNEKTPHSLRMAYAKGDPKVALVMEFRGKKHRIVRRAAADSLRLQMEEQGGWKELAAGPRVEPFMRQNMALPDFETFWILNLWRYEASAGAVAAFDIDSVDARTKDLILRYRHAREAERAEDEVKSMESRIAELRRELGQGFALEDKLVKGKELLKEIDVAELSRDDLELLKRKDQLLGDFRDQLDRLTGEEEAERNHISDTLPQRPFKSPIFLAGLAVGLLGLGAGVAMQDTPWRALALLDLFGFGASVWILIQYFAGMERASVHQVRHESIKRRLNQVREEQVSLQGRLNHVLIHARVDDATDLDERVVKAEKLKLAIEKMEDHVNELRRDPAYQRAREELDTLEEKLTQGRRPSADGSAEVMSAYQLESDLESLGIDVKMLSEEPAHPDEETDPLTRLWDTARNTQQWEADQLFDKTRKMWGKISGHVLGDRFKDVDLDPAGKLVISSLGPDQVEMWARTRPSEQHVVWLSLALALQVNAHERSTRGVFEAMIVPDPAQNLTADQTKKLMEVLASAARRSPALLLRTKN